MARFSTFPAHLQTPQPAGQGGQAKTPSEALVLGIDPGLQHTGWGIVRKAGSQLQFVACGTIHTQASQPDAVRLHHLFTGLQGVVAEYQPTHAAVEEVFVNKNARSSLKLGQARGMGLLVPQMVGIPVAEYAALVVKKTVVGTGRAEKHQIAHMLKLLLPSAQPDSEDAADALAVAITHANHL